MNCDFFSLIVSSFFIQFKIQLYSHTIEWRYFLRLYDYFLIQLITSIELGKWRLIQLKLSIEVTDSIEPIQLKLSIEVINCMKKEGTTLMSVPFTKTLVLDTHTQNLHTIVWILCVFYSIFIQLNIQLYVERDTHIHECVLFSFFNCIIYSYNWRLYECVCMNTHTQWKKKRTNTFFHCLWVHTQCKIVFVIHTIEKIQVVPSFFIQLITSIDNFNWIGSIESVTSIDNFNWISLHFPSLQLNQFNRIGN